MTVKPTAQTVGRQCSFIERNTNWFRSMLNEAKEMDVSPSSSLNIEDDEEYLPQNIVLVWNVLSSRLEHMHVALAHLLWLFTCIFTRVGVGLDD